MKKLIWNVYVYSHNCNEIYVHNVFDHWRFMEDLDKINKRIKRKFKNTVCVNNEEYNLFVEEVKRSLMYFYWSKSEWEVIITSWPPYVNEKGFLRLNLKRNEHLVKYGRFIRTDVNIEGEKKVDVYEQIMLNWDHFITYLWNNRKLIKPKQPKFEKTDPSEPSYL